MASRPSWAPAKMRDGSRMSAMGSAGPTPDIATYLRTQLATSPVVAHQLRALDGGTWHTAVTIAEAPSLDPTVLAALVDLLRSDPAPELELWMALAGHRDMSDLTHLVFEPTSAGWLTHSPHLLAGLGEKIGARTLLDLIDACDGVTRAALLGAYRACAAHPIDDLLARAVTSPHGPDLLAAVTTAILGGGRLGPASAALVAASGTLTGAGRAVLESFTLEDAGAIVVLAGANTKDTTALLRSLLEHPPAGLAISAAQAVTIAAIKDAPVRRRVLNLVNLADHLCDEQLNDYAARASGLTAWAAAALLAGHGGRLNHGALAMVLSKLSPQGLASALSGPHNERLFAAAAATPHIDATLATWLDSMDDRRDVGLGDKPMVMTLLCHHLSALDHVLTGATHTTLRTLSELDLQAHLVATVEADLGAGSAGWTALAAVMASPDVQTLPELISLARTLLAAPAPS